MNKVVFLDRDGIINREMGTYVFSMNEFILNDGLEKALTHWKRLGYSFAIVTNQGGISKQIYGHKDVAIINDYLLIGIAVVVVILVLILIVAIIILFKRLKKSEERAKSIYLQAVDSERSTLH